MVASDALKLSFTKGRQRTSIERAYQVCYILAQIIRCGRNLVRRFYRRVRQLWRRDRKSLYSPDDLPSSTRDGRNNKLPKAPPKFADRSSHRAVLADRGRSCTTH